MQFEVSEISVRHYEGDIHIHMVIPDDELGDRDAMGRGLDASALLRLHRATAVTARVEDPSNPRTWFCKHANTGLRCRMEFETFERKKTTPAEEAGSEAAADLARVAAQAERAEHVPPVTDDGPLARDGQEERAQPVGGDCETDRPAGMADEDRPTESPAESQAADGEPLVN